MSSQPWYKDGLQFSCTQCGDCCTGEPGFVWISEEEEKQIAEYRGISVGEFKIHHTKLVGDRLSLREFANGDCTFFDGATRKCSIYPVRPVQCRTWPFWKSNLEDPETWNDVVSVCPGAGCGALIPLEQIQKLANERDV
ncbi:YkgJ family cysteine cluster protein [Candidatus Woesearchaeota archaeon]|nr:YkgJ family cysteine cluster protein [Candidatus Woesearchaeota archaeon]